MTNAAIQGPEVWQIEAIINGWFGVDDPLLPNGTRQGRPLWKLMEDAKMASPLLIMEWVRYLRLPDRHPTTRVVYEPQRAVE